MSFLDPAAIEILAVLKETHFPFPRQEQLEGTFKTVLNDYFAHLAIGHSFEAEGITVTGESRTGKTHEVKRLIKKFNEQQNLLPDGMAARIVSCNLSGHLSWKDLGTRALHALGYPLKSTRTQDYIWQLVEEQARIQGVIGLHFDEAQHMFSEAPIKRTNG